jgi:hypothetical protein
MDEETMDETMAFKRLRERPMYFHRDGTPIVSDDLLPDFMQWALLFEEGKDRIVAQTETLYGEKLSTVFLGMDHSFGCGPPLIFETMLFAPKRGEGHQDAMKLLTLTMDDDEKREYKLHEQYVAKHFPHDQLQLRYHTEIEARDTHDQLRLHCLIPPRWRHFLLGTVGGYQMWK